MKREVEQQLYDLGVSDYEAKAATLQDFLKSTDHS